MDRSGAGKSTTVGRYTTLYSEGLRVAVQVLIAVVIPLPAEYENNYPEIEIVKFENINE